jgi:hypothetical protein
MSRAMGATNNRYDSTIDMNLAIVEEIYSRIYPNNNTNNTGNDMKKKINNTNAESQRKTLIMVLWISLVFCTGRFASVVSNLILLFMQDTVYNWWASAFNFFYMALVYATYFFVYMRTNKMFRKKFYKIFLRKDIK